MSKDPESKQPSVESVLQQMEALKQATHKDSPKVAPSGDAAKIAIDFASASAAGCLLGYGLDYWLGISPWGLIGGLFLGVAAGVKLMFTAEARAEKKRQAEANNDTKE